MREKTPFPFDFFFPNPIRNLLPLIPRYAELIIPSTPSLFPRPSSSHFLRDCSARVLPLRASLPFALRVQRVVAGFRRCLSPTLRTPFPCSYNFSPFDLPANGRI